MNSLEPIKKMQEEKKQEQEKDSKQDFEKQLQKVKTLKTMLAEGVPQIEWRVENILPKQGITIVGGTAGSLKSWAAMQLALACATGTPFLEQFDTQRCTVLYIDEENGNITIPFRFDKLVRGHFISDVPDNLHISIFNNVTLDDNSYGKPLLKALIDRFKPELVILDSMVRCINGNEDKSEDVKKVFQTIKGYLEKGIAFVLLHHTVKKPTKAMAGLRGSGDFSAFADSVLMFQRGKEGFCNVNTVKNRHIAVEDVGEFFFVLENLPGDAIKLEWKGTRDAQGDVIERCIEDISEWIRRDEIRRFETKQVSKLTQPLGYSKNSYQTALKMMTERELLTKLKRGHYLVSSQILSEEEVITQ